MPLVQTRGAASAQGFGEFAQATAVNYIEDVFSCFLYSGTGSSQTITNNIDLSTKGGLTWIKARDDTSNHALTDTVRGTNAQLNSNDSGTGTTSASVVTAFNTTGFNLGTAAVSNRNGFTFVSWTFREQPKFFDVVTYTGTGSNTTIAHSLGSVPGSIIVKRTDTTAAWAVYHRSLANTQYLVLNNDAAAATGATWWNSTTPTSSVFSVGTDATVNASAGTYVAYIFAHDAGGFGLTGTDNVISCGSYSGTGTNPNPVTLGYEPQWLLIKRVVGGTGNWHLVDIMRGMTGTDDRTLFANLDAAESLPNVARATATGFEVTGTGAAVNFSGNTYIYIAIRRGPMKVPTLGTSVFMPVTYTGNGTTQTVASGNAPLDLVWIKGRSPDPENPRIYDRLRGATKSIDSTSTAAETTRADGLTAFTQTGFTVGSFGNENGSGSNIVSWNFCRAPSFFDEVCYTNPPSSPVDQTHSHNLGVVPTLVITKGRNQVGGWIVLLDSSILGSVKYLYLDTTDAAAPGITYTATTTQYTTSFLGNYNETQVAYLFATLAGVSKVGSYTGTGTTLQINCGFTAGARFVLIKRTDSTGDWYVWDSARGIVAGNDPYLLLNSTAAEVTGTDYVDTYSAGFEISSTAPAAINASAGSFIFLAIA